jgi:ABC-type branched-subunit amino acid transport system substrate-binding protein
MATVPSDPTPQPVSAAPVGGHLSSGRLSRRNLLIQAAWGAAGLAAAGPLAACGGGSSGGGSSTPKQTLTIGLLAPITGPVAPEGEALRRGFEMGVKLVNGKGGVLGSPVTFTVEDDQGTPSVATTAAKKLIQRDQVDMIFGTITGDTTLAVKQIAAQAKLIFMKAILDDYEHSDMCSELLFKLGESDAQLLKPSVPFMVSKYGRQVALVGSDYSFPHAYNATAKPLLDAAGAQVVAEEYSPLGTTEWSSVIGKLKAANPDFILSSVVGGDAIALLKQADALGLLKTVGITGVSLNQEFYPAVPDIMNGRYVTVRYTDQLDNSANQVFVQEYRTTYKDTTPIAVVTANAYIGVQLLAAAMNAAGTTDAAKTADQLRKVTMSDTIYGPDQIAFDPNNQILDTAIYLTQIEPGGKYTVRQTAGVTADPTKC